MDEPRPPSPDAALPRSISTQLSAPPVPAAPPRPQCLEIDELVAMVDGTLPSERSDEVLAHVDGCASCAEVVGNLGLVGGEPRKLGRYRLERLLGVGGMGMVYSARDPQLQRQVAVKLVRPEHASERSRERMLGEARALARVSHPNVISVYDVGEHDGELFLATELVDGETLGAWQVGRGTEAIVGAWVQVARGLAAAHAEGVVHRDVKPANALVGRDGRVRIGDFGIAVQLPTGEEASAGGASRAEGESTSEVAGTPAYMAPEQADGVVDARSDQFSVCVALVEALTRRRPVADEEIALQPKALAGLANVLRRGLRRDPDARFRSMDELADALVAAMTAATSAPSRPRRRRRIAALAGIAAISLGAVAAAIALRGGQGDACTPARLPAELATASARASLKAALPADPEPQLAVWVAEWSAGQADVCVSSRDDAAMRARRRRCLDDQLAQLEQLLARWQRGAVPSDPMAVLVALDALPRAARCSHAALRATAEPSAAQVAEIARVRDELRELASPDRASAIASVSTLVERAEAIGHAPFAIEVARKLAALQAATDRAAARQTLQRAIERAAPRGESFERATARVELVSLLAAPAEAEALAEDARGHLAELGGDRMLEATLDYNLGKVCHDARRSDEAMAAFERARRGYRAVDGPDGLHEAVVLISIAGVHYQRGVDSKAGDAALTAAGAIFQRVGVTAPIGPPELETAKLIAQLEALYQQARSSGARTEGAFHAEHALAAAYLLAEQPERALRHYRQAAELGEALGLRSDKLPYALSQIAAILIDQKQLDEAEAPVRRAIELAEQLGLEAELASALSVQGRLLLERGDPTAARAPLTRALEIRTRTNEPARLRGNTRFSLAQALWSDEPQRARELAHAARVDLRGALDSTPPEQRGAEHVRRGLQERLDEIDRWLKSRAR